MSKLPPLVHLLDPKSIIIDREKRQRKVFTTEDLKESIRLRGQFTPIIVEKQDRGTVLIAGERRLTTFLENPSFGEIQAIFFEEMGEVDRQILELEENIRRQDLSWQEVCEAILAIHELYLKEDSSWNVRKTAEYIGFSYENTWRMIEVGKELRLGNPKAEEASGWTTAWTKIENQRERKREHAEAQLSSSIADSFQELEADSYSPEDVKAIQAGIKRKVEAQVEAAAAPSSDEASPLSVPLMNGDALQFFSSYNGIPFNFGHFDFPYGIDYDKMDQAHTENFGGYEDSPEVYFELLNAFCKSLDRVFSSSAHIMFWFSPKLWDETHEFLRKNAPDLWIQDIPLVWLKSDNKGILSDPHRRPRNITEFALILSRGDRKIVKPVANAYAAPTSKIIHGSEKPVPVLRHFFQMFLDGTSRVLDPTAGSANSLVAALDFSPALMLGIEKDPEFYSLSSASLKKALTLKQMEKKKND